MRVVDAGAHLAMTPSARDVTLRHIRCVNGHNCNEHMESQSKRVEIEAALVFVY